MNKEAIVLTGLQRHKKKIYHYKDSYRFTSEINYMVFYITLITGNGLAFLLSHRVLGKVLMVFVFMFMAFYGL